MKNGLLTAGGIFLFLLVVFGISAISYNNREAEIKNLISAKQTDNQNIFDTVWKTISQQAQITQEYKKTFIEIYPALIEGRYEGKNSLMSFIQESNPNFDTSLYRQLMVTIEAQRLRFESNQRQLIDYKRELDNLATKFPSRWFVDNDADITIITSERTKEIFSSGEDNNVNLF